MTETVKAWAVWNMELNVPCVITVQTKEDTGDGSHFEVGGKAIWMEDSYLARQQAIDYLNTFPRGMRKEIKLKKIEITVL